MFIKIKLIQTGSKNEYKQDSKMNKNRKLKLMQIGNIQLIQTGSKKGIQTGSKNECKQESKMNLNMILK